MTSIARELHSRPPLLCASRHSTKRQTRYPSSEHSAKMQHRHRIVQMPRKARTVPNPFDLVALPCREVAFPRRPFLARRQTSAQFSPPATLQTMCEITPQVHRKQNCAATATKGKCGSHQVSGVDICVVLEQHTRRIDVSFERSIHQRRRPALPKANPTSSEVQHSLSHANLAHSTKP